MKNANLLPHPVSPIVPMVADDSRVRPMMADESHVIPMEQPLILDRELRDRAERLWPDSEHNRRQWLRSVGQLRAAGRWVLDAGTPPPGWHATAV